MRHYRKSSGRQLWNESHAHADLISTANAIQSCSTHLLDSKDNRILIAMICRSTTGKERGGHLANTRYGLERGLMKMSRGLQGLLLGFCQRKQPEGEIHEVGG